VHSALEATLLADGPALCEAVVDPFEPPLPARANAKQGSTWPRRWRKGSRTAGGLR